MASTYIYNGYLKLKPIFWVLKTNHDLSRLKGVALQVDIITNFQLQRIGSYWQRLIQSAQISMDKLCRLKASLQNQKHKIGSNIFENISFEAADH